MEKVHSTKLGGGLAQISKSPLPIESHRILSIPLTSYDNPCKVLSARDVRMSLGGQGF